MRNVKLCLSIFAVVIWMSFSIAQAQPPAASATATWAGIGAVISVQTVPGTQANGLFISGVIPGGAAANAGMQAGAQIMAVDGKEIRGHSIAEVVNLIRGRQGTTVKVAVRPAGSKERIEFTMVREPVAEPQTMPQRATRPNRPMLHYPERELGNIQELPASTSGGHQPAMVIQGETLFVLYGGVLYKFNADTMQQIKAVPLTPPMLPEMRRMRPRIN